MIAGVWRISFLRCNNFDQDKIGIYEILMWLIVDEKKSVKMSTLNWAVRGALLHCSAFLRRASFEIEVAFAIASLSSNARLMNKW